MGDVNGDGLDDIIIGATGNSHNAINAAGASYVIFGEENTNFSTLNVSQLDGTNGFKISGSIQNEKSGHHVSSAGDLNGDGVNDNMISSYGADFTNSEGGFSHHTGLVYIIYGSSSGFNANLDLSALDGSNGFTIYGEEDYTSAGKQTSNLGDVNGDGLDDIIISGQKVGDAGTVYVVFGSNSGFGDSLYLKNLDGENGFKIIGIDDNDRIGFSVSSAGDINNDGINDILIGSRNADSFKGEVYVIFGSSTGFNSNFYLSTLDGSNGFTIKGTNDFDKLGSSVSSAGDINGDGIDDIIIGAPQYTEAGSAYIIYGKEGGWATTYYAHELEAATTSSGGVQAQALIDDFFKLDFSSIVNGEGDGITNYEISQQFEDEDKVFDETSDKWPNNDLPLHFQPDLELNVSYSDYGE